MKLTTRHGMCLLAFATSLVCVCAINSLAQDSQKSSLPRIGTIKDYPATGLMTGCGNLYFHQRGQAKSTDAVYVFLARGDGSGAWMNFNGRDVRLRQIKRAASAHQRPRTFAYRYGDWQITVVIENFHSKNAAGASDPMYQMKITVRKGRAVRVVQAIGDADC